LVRIERSESWTIALHVSLAMREATHEGLSAIELVVVFMN